MYKERQILTVSLLASVTILASLLILIPETADEADAVTVGEFSYGMNTDGTSNVLSYLGTDPDVVIPESVVIDGKTYPVCSISRFAFENNQIVRTVWMPDTIQRIGDGAFRNCTSLESIRLSEYRDGYRCLSFNTEVFDGCSSLKELIIPDTVTGLSDNSIGRCESLEYIYLGGVWTIPDGLLYGCPALKKVTITSETTTIDGAFTYLPNLETIDVSDSTRFKVVDGAVYNSIITRLLAYPGGLAGVLEIPDGVVTIEDNVLIGANEITGLRVPASLEEFGANNLYNLHGLEWIQVDEGNPIYSSIDGVLYNSDATELLRYPHSKGGTAAIADTVSTISSSAFAKSDIVGVTIPDSVTVIPYNCFSNCSALAYVDLGNVVEIESFAFENCTSLESLRLPESLRTIGRSAFSGCSNLYEIVNDSDLDIIAGSSEHGMVSYYAGNVHASGESGMFVDIIDGPHTWSFSEMDGEYVLQRYRGPGGDLSLPSSFTVDGRTVTSYSMANSLFEGNEKITAVTVPGAVEKISSYAFKNCVNLESAVFQDGVKTVGYQMLYGCTSLTELDLGTMENFGDEEFYGCTALKTVTIPRTWTTWSSMIFEHCTGIEEFIVEDGHPAFYTVDGVVYNRYTSTLEMFPYGKSGHFSIPDGITTTCEMGFASNLTSIYIPDSTTDIGFYNLRFCESLEYVYVGDGNPSYRSIEGVLFSKDGSTLLQYPAAREGDYAIPDGVTTLRDYSFYGASLEEVYFPEGLKETGWRTFEGCDNLRYIRFNADLHEISGSFRDCPSLTSVTIPSSVETIYNFAFLNCSKLGSVVLLGDVQTIQSQAFDDCLNPLIIYCPEGTNTDISLFDTKFVRSGEVVRIDLVVDGKTHHMSALSGAPLVIGVPSSEGYEIIGWTPELPVVAPEVSTTYTAVLERALFNVSFVVDGSVVHTESVRYGDSIPLPSDPVKDGSQFACWDGMPVSMPARDIIVEAVWMSNPVVTDDDAIVTGDGSMVVFVPTDAGMDHVVSGILDFSDTATTWTARVSGETIAEGAEYRIAVESSENPALIGPYAMVFDVTAISNGSQIDESITYTVMKGIPDGYDQVQIWLINDDGSREMLAGSHDAESISFTLVGSGTVAVESSLTYNSETHPLILIIVVIVIAVLIAVAYLVLRRRKHRTDSA